jgi:hypothetical protein
MKIVKYKGKYLTKEIVEDCFIGGQHTMVDKNVTGNGFTFNFLKIAPRMGKFNIIIAPNTKVVMGKQDNYIANKGNKLITSFIYGGDGSDRLDLYGSTQVTMIVTDSFYNHIETFKTFAHKIDKIMIDESHSSLIQSSFREKLVKFKELIDVNFPDTARVSVTATPMLFQKVDIKLLGDSIEQRDIFVSENQEDSIKRALDLLEAGEKVLVALQDSIVIKRFIKNGVLDANIKIGESLLARIMEMTKFVNNEDSNLTIISSAGFEGFDLEVDTDVNVFIFEDRTQDYTTFYPQNIVQIIGRPRQGTKRIEWFRRGAEGYLMKSIKEMQRIADNENIPLKTKFKDPRYSFIPRFFDREFDELGLTESLVIDEVKYNLEKEMNDGNIKSYIQMYYDFFKVRGFTLKIMDNGRQVIKSRKPSPSQSRANTLTNHNEIMELNPFKDTQCDLRSHKLTPNGMVRKTLKDFLKTYEEYLVRAFFVVDGSILDDDFTPAEWDNYLVVNRALRVLSILRNEDEIDAAVDYIIKESLKWKKATSTRREQKGAEYQEWVINLKRNTKTNYILLLMAVGQKNFQIPPKIVGSRDYNIFTQVSIDLVQAVMEEIGEYDFNEVDINTCNIRILYAACGLEPPKDIYGDNKKNKKKINSLINRSSLEYAESKKLDASSYKKNIIRDYKKYNIHRDVIDFIMSNFWERTNDSMFEYCSKVEQEVLNKLQHELLNLKGDRDFKMIRRHDSIITLGNMRGLDDVVRNFTFKDQKGWFDEDFVFQELE